MKTTHPYIEQFARDLRQDWGPLTTALIARSQALLETLARANVVTGDDRELYRDPDHGFVLLTHSSREGTYRDPHDHGRGWVLYAVQNGEVEMGSYAVVGANVVRRDLSRVRAGEVRVYLPGDIHDTRCISSEVRLLRLTSVDLKVEELEGRLSRYPRP